MDYKKLYEKQYGKKKLVSLPLRQFWGLRKLFKKYDKSRYDVALELIEPGIRILDIGCGDGYMLQRCKRKFEELYGLDIAPSRISEAKINVKKLHPNMASKFNFIERNADDYLPFADSIFDTIICIASIEHIYDIFALVREMHRLLKQGGYVIAQVPNIAYFKHRLAILLGKLPITSSPFNWQEIGWDGGHIHYFTMNKFCWLFESSGFHIEKKCGSGFLCNVRSLYSSLLSGDLIIKARKSQ
jgi:methionine biosynthesis protein MetW